MAKKQQIPIWAWAIIALLVLLVLNQKGIIEIPFIPGEIVEPQILKGTPTGECSISLDKYLINAGDLVRGTIYDGPFANCDIFVRMNGGLWINSGTYQLDINGEFSYETPVNIPGTYEILGVCTTNTGSCKTNTEILTVGGTPTGDYDGDGIPDNLDPDDDNDGWPDDEEIEAGTNPFDRYDYPTGDDVPIEPTDPCVENNPDPSTYFDWIQNPDPVCWQYAENDCQSKGLFGFVNAWHIASECCYWECISCEGYADYQGYEHSYTYPTSEESCQMAADSSCLGEPASRVWFWKDGCCMFDC